MTETLNNPFQELSSFKIPSFSEMRQGVVNKLTEKRYVDVPTPTQQQVLQSEIDKQMKIERNLLQSRGLSTGEIETRVAERAEQARGRLMRDDERFQGMVTESGVASGYRAVNTPVAVGDVAPDLNERLSQYEGGAKLESPSEVFTTRTSDTLRKVAAQRRFEGQMPTVEQMTRISPFEEAQEWLKQYVHNSSTGLDAAAENYIRKHYGEDIWKRLFNSSPNAS